MTRPARARERKHPGPVPGARGRVMAEARNRGGGFEPGMALAFPEVADGVSGDGRLTRPGRIILWAGAGDALGTITAVANVAGGSGPGFGFGPLVSVPPAEFRRVLDVNLVGAFLMARLPEGRAVGNVQYSRARLRQRFPRARPWGVSGPTPRANGNRSGAADEFSQPRIVYLHCVTDNRAALRIDRCVVQDRLRSSFKSIHYSCGSGCPVCVRCFVAHGCATIICHDRHPFSRRLMV